MILANNLLSRELPFDRCFLFTTEFLLDNYHYSHSVQTYCCSQRVFSLFSITEHDISYQKRNICRQAKNRKERKKERKKKTGRMNEDRNHSQITLHARMLNEFVLLNNTCATFFVESSMTCSAQRNLSDRSEEIENEQFECCCCCCCVVVVLGYEYNFPRYT